ncbi:MAG: hypothetical protein M1840_007163 [Geoglossum simile]|nr:MAG: hypothetical protein M1840_007163 [Geoglossum simile]
MAGTPKTASTSSTLYSEDQSRIPEDAGSPGSLGIGPKGESSFPCLDNFSESTTPVAGSSPPEDQHFFWDQSANKYRIVEFPGSSYPFVVNRQFRKPNTKPKSSIDIKSEGLRAVVLQALEDGNNDLAYSTFREEGITVDLDVFLESIPQLEHRLAIYTGFTSATPRKRTDTPGEYLKLLVEFLKPLREIDTSPTTRTGEVDMLSVMIPAEDAPQSHTAFEDTTGKLLGS